MQTIRACLVGAALALTASAVNAAPIIYWSLFNIEGESAITADFVTYATLDDMLNDINRLGVFQPMGGGAGENVVGSGSDGTTYWNLFNIEGESAITADFVTYATFDEMLNDINRLGVFQPMGGGAGQNVVGSGSDGTTYWNLFNIEGESAITADFVTYATLEDMLNDTNRLGVFQPIGGGAGQNVVGSGATILSISPPPPAPIPLPSSIWLLGIGLTIIGWSSRRAQQGHSFRKRGRTDHKAPGRVEDRVPSP
jgi:hypothetical protein